MRIYPSLQGETYPVVRRPYFDTIVAKASSGLEVRVGNYTYPLSEWDIPYTWLSQEAAIADFQTLYGLYVLSAGQFDAILYSDPNDNTTSPVVASPTPSTIGTGTGALTTFQIGRVLGGAFEPVFDINNTPNAPKIYLNSTLQSSGYTISATGLITFTSAPGNGVLVKADFYYYWRVRFAMDDLEFTNFVHDWWEVKKVTLRQVRV